MSLMNPDLIGSAELSCLLQYILKYPDSKFLYKIALVLIHTPE